MSKGSDRRATIRDVSAALFATHGVAATTVRDIGEAAGVLSGSLYHYFPSKNAILAEVLVEFMSDIHAAFREVVARGESPARTVRGMIHATLRVIETHPHATAIYQNDRAYLRDHDLLAEVDAQARLIREHWMAAITAGVQDGTFRADIPVEIFYRSLRDALWASMHWPSRDSHTTEELGDLLAALFLEGFTPRG
ncbi:TetR/AcrR family transcriptional regulator [Nocardioides sp. zg-DK7169]|uniref:TetR/AcrR family transcriptional regulator n=1 Tax=Nocardioides sp. zg-DK7169 TaxID=2736600 RepID=UPI001556F3A6|nr:TetR/AcrR family transcriptional regulator [Nocardioides sp. zg-DK7169]NPC98696.1 TetR/AcrR family transcriptional regulator [Nocardioides sp. zg-DK7169]